MPSGPDGHTGGVTGGENRKENVAYTGMIAARRPATSHIAGLFRNRHTAVTNGSRRPHTKPSDDVFRRGLPWMEATEAGGRRRRKANEVYRIPRCGRRIPFCIALCSIALLALRPAAAVAQEGAAEAEVSQPAGTARPVAAVGSVHLVVFAADLPARGAVVEGPDGQRATGDAGGALTLELPAGEHTLLLYWPADAAPRPMAGVTVAAGQSTQVIATAALDGTLSLDIMAPEGAGKAAAVDAAVAVTLGSVSGIVTSDEGGEPVVGARVYVAGQAAEATTDAEGRFSLQVPVGSHVLSVLHTKYSTQKVPGVEVTEGATAEVEVQLTPAAIELEDFVITAPHISGGVASVMDERRDSAAVSDGIGAEDIARMPASDAAQAAQRVVGATIVGGRFIYVRGLGERYSNALLNGAPLPSPEPDRATVPLDLFPAQILQSIDISKTFTPDMPANFAGGSIRIRTKRVPEQPVFGVSLSAGFNSESTFTKPYGPAETGSYDYLGFDDGGRALSDKIPTDFLVKNPSERPDGTIAYADDVYPFSDDINSPMHAQKRTMWPNMSASIAGGRSWKWGKDGKVGVLTSLVYRRKFSRRKEKLLDVRPAPLDQVAWGFRPKNELRSVNATDGVRWGAFTNTTVEFDKLNKVSLLVMHSQLSDRVTRHMTGSNAQLDSDLGALRHEYATRGLTNGQLQGEHIFEPLQEAKLEWLLSLAGANRDEDDTRDLLYLKNQPTDVKPNPLFIFSTQPSSGRHFFSNQTEVAKVAGLDWTQPILTNDVELSAKVGGLASLKDREFSSRTFRLKTDNGATSDTVSEDFLDCGASFDPVACPRDLFSDRIVGEGLFIEETTDRGTDTYEAALNVWAGYAMAEFGILDGAWRFIAGARMEHTLQRIDPIDLFTGEPGEDNARLEQTDVLPAAAVVFSPVEEGAVRLAVSQTLARPQLRELAPFAYQNYFGGFRESGNADLKLTKISNADLRFEFFPSPSEVAAVSFFAKDFKDPIEPIIRPSSDTSVLTYQNARGALLYGLELETRKNLAFVSESLEDFGVIASLMLADSSIRIDNNGFVTNDKRPLVQAAPYSFNAALDYENEHGTLARVLYNLTGRRIVQVGSDTLDDAYQQPQHVVDLSASQNIGEHWKLRLTLKNALNAPFVVTLGKHRASGHDNVLRRYRDGVSLSLGVGYTP